MLYTIQDYIILNILKKTICVPISIQYLYYNNHYYNLIIFKIVAK